MEFGDSKGASDSVFGSCEPSKSDSERLKDSRDHVSQIETGDVSEDDLDDLELTEGDSQPHPSTDVPAPVQGMPSDDGLGDHIERKRVSIQEQMDLIKRVNERQLTIESAAKLAGVSIRTFQRKRDSVRDLNEEGLIHKACGKPSNHRVPDEIRARVVELLETWPTGGGPTVIQELLSEQQGINLSVETVRQIMIRLGIWKGGTRSLQHRRTRERRSSFGELVQMDTSEHDWFNLGGDNKAYFIGMIDDATGTVLGHFYDSDSTLTNMDCLKRYCQKYGRPVCIYVDRASHFKYNPQGGKDNLKDLPETQIERACRELAIGVIHAHSPQGKGRVERLFRTLQGRLAYHLNYRRITDIMTANEFLVKVFLDKFNAKFTKHPACAVNLHRTIEGFNLDGILCVNDLRVVNKDHTIKFGGRKYQLHMREGFPDLYRRKVVVETRLDGTLKVKYNSIYINFSAVR
jgi:hypothetical protein